MATRQEIKALLRENSLGYEAGKRDCIDFYTISEKNYTSNWKYLIKDNMRKAIHGCKDDYPMVRSYWLGYILGFIQTGRAK